MSTKQVNKGGKLPVSAKKAADMSDFSDLEQLNLLAIDEGLKKELDDKGLAFRWINAKVYMNGGNFHKSGWTAYRRSASTQPKETHEFQYGTSPEGFIIRHDLLLAVKPKEQQERWKQYLGVKAARQSASNDENIKKFKEKAKESGAKVHEGYDDND